MIEVKEIRKNYSDVEALKVINLKLPERSRLGLLGNNGAGKSTLMKILSTLEKPDAGSVFIE